jgi:hypothetical protein
MSVAPETPILGLIRRISDGLWCAHRLFQKEDSKLTRSSDQGQPGRCCSYPGLWPG